MGVFAILMWFMYYNSMSMKKHIVVIHGGDAWDTYEDYLNYLRDYEFTEEKFHKTTTRRWKDHLQDDLGERVLVVKPQMPCDRNAKYVEWKIWFDKIVPYIDDGAVFVGHSLGATFLAKYLAENTLPISLTQLHLVAGCYGWHGGFELPHALDAITEACRDIFIYHSHDDMVVDFTDAQKYKNALPTAQLITFDDRGHFLDSHFPVLVDNIRAVL